MCPVHKYKRHRLQVLGKYSGYISKGYSYIPHFLTRQTLTWQNQVTGHVFTGEDVKDRIVD